VLCYALVGRLIFWGVDCFSIDAWNGYTFEIRGEYGNGMGLHLWEERVVRFMLSRMACWLLAFVVCDGDGEDDRIDRYELIPS
jgi:hypothetical protein